jgi:hypothetical protein
VHQEAFESRHTSRRQIGERVHVAANYAAPCRPIHPRLSARRLALAFESRQIDDFRRAVKGHIDQRRHAARGRGARRGREAFPLRAAGLVDVHMGVDQAGKQNIVAEVVQAGNGRHFVPSANGSDVLMFHQQGGWTKASRRDHASGTKRV